MKVIVAIGGGEVGSIYKESKYETELIDQEIVKLAGKDNPHVLVVPHATPPEMEYRSYQNIRNNYQNLNCTVKYLRRKKLSDLEYVNNLINWSDIIYVPGGDTIKMLELWYQNGFDKILKDAYEKGKLLCGNSAGANCWFSDFNTDCDNPNNLKGIGLINAYLTPHAEERKESIKKNLKNNDIIGISIPTATAIVVVDNKYRVINTTENKIYINYYQGNEYIEKEINNTEYKYLKDIIRR